MKMKMCFYLSILIGFIINYAMIRSGIPSLIALLIAFIVTMVCMYASKRLYFLNDENQQLKRLNEQLNNPDNVQPLSPDLLTRMNAIRLAAEETKARQRRQS
ncbi:hypothetical protein EAY46_15625 [Vibrio anguillarum]|uniref:Uncharacterized protein n=1 Tax=Vibrio anguillarum TaxID=55601 RepID=A0ABR9Z8S4_VIBAN|nr:hypothetical protein [Vibrio anguillarum]